MRLLAALGALGLAATAAVAAPPIVMINPPDTSSSFVTNIALSGFQTTGGLMTGLKVRVEYDSVLGATEASWITTGPASGRATGPDWQVTASGDTFSATWEFRNLGPNRIKRIRFDGIPGSTVFDRTYNSQFGTPGSFYGQDFQLVSAPDDLVITVTYRVPVGVGGAAPINPPDIFRYMDLQFTNTGGLPGNSAFQFNADTDNLRFASDDCDCWMQPQPDLTRSQASHEGGGLPFGSKVADDFYLQEGRVYEFQSISATVMTNIFPALQKFRAELYEDCDGTPGKLLYTFDQSSVNNTLDPTPLTGYRRVDVQFRPVDQADPNIRSIFLKGGVYWVSVYGVSANLCDQASGDTSLCDLTYWATSASSVGPMVGSVPKKINGLPRSNGQPFNYTNQPWVSIADCCIGCRNMAMEVCAKPCKILHDNGQPALVGNAAGVLSSYTSTAPQFDPRAADDFVVPPCAGTNAAFDSNTVCYIEACIYTNCNPPTGYAEIYADDCHKPGAFQTRLTATKASRVPGTIQVDGQTLYRYRLEFHRPDFVLTPGRQYWISVSAGQNGAADTRTVWCYASDCDRTCQISWNRSKKVRLLGQATGVLPPDSYDVGPWVENAGDLSFLIAVSSPPIVLGVTNALPGAGANAFCPVDWDGNRVLDILDIFSYIETWFAGCP